jgi:hypothetical protein
MSVERQELLVRRLLAGLVCLLSVLGVVVVATAPAASAATNAGLVYSPLSAPKRVVNTGSSSPAENRKGSVGRGAGTSPTMYGVPSSASAVAVTITAYGSSAAGALVTYAYKSTRPTAAMLQFAKGQSVSEFIIVPLVSDKINIFNTGTSGSVQIAVDVAGYYKKATGSSTVALTHVLPNAVRMVDTTTGKGAAKAAVPAQHSISPVVTGGSSAPTATTGEVLASVSVISATKVRARASPRCTSTQGGARPPC